MAGGHCSPRTTLPQPGEWPLAAKNSLVQSATAALLSMGNEGLHMPFSKATTSWGMMARSRVL
eukprot:2420589-Lingulodinium_polyedra.AAC.1